LNPIDILVVKLDKEVINPVLKIDRSREREWGKTRIKISLFREGQLLPDGRQLLTGRIKLLDLSPLSLCIKSLANL
jgi:hypothetical protein